MERILPAGGLLLIHLLRHQLLNPKLLLRVLPFLRNIVRIVIVVDHDPNGVFVLPWQHEFLGLEVLLACALLRLTQLFHPICVAQGVEGVL